MALSLGTRVTDRYQEATGTVVGAETASVRQAGTANGRYGQASGRVAVTEYTVKWDGYADPCTGYREADLRTLA